MIYALGFLGYIWLLNDLRVFAVVSLPMHFIEIMCDPSLNDDESV